MLYERQIADEFWRFVRCRAIDGRSCIPEERQGSRTLEALEVAASWAHMAIRGIGPREEPPCLSDDPGQPWLYPTVQDALLAYLVNQVALSLFPYPYEMWLRAVTLVIADAQRDPAWLHIKGRQWIEGDYEGEVPHHMTISDDWSCLSRETFDFTVREYAGKG